MHILLSVILIFKLLSKRDFELGYHIHQHYSITRIDIFDELHFLRNLQRFALIFANIKEFIFTGKCHFFIAKFGPPKEKKTSDNNCYKQTTIIVNCRYHFNNRGGCRFSIALVINNNNTNSFIQRN